MGKHPAPLPGELRYCKNHMWCRPGADGVHTFGFTAYAVRLMQDVYFLEWRIDPGLVTPKQEIGYIETQKATSGLYAPLAGPDRAVQRRAARRPRHDQRRQLRRGLAVRVRRRLADTLDVDAYYAHLEAGWETTQRMLKGQVNKSDDEDETELSSQS